MEQPSLVVDKRLFKEQIKEMVNAKFHLQKHSQQNLNSPSVSNVWSMYALSFQYSRSLRELLLIDQENHYRGRNHIDYEEFTVHKYTYTQGF